MFKIAHSVFFFLFAPLALCSKNNSNLNSHILRNKIPSSDKRYETFYLFMSELNRKSMPTLVETGIARNGCRNCRGDGCSTIIFAEWMRANGGYFYSVDIDPKAVRTAEEALGELNHYVHISCQDSIEFLSHFDRTIDFLYLDSFDFEFDHPEPSQIHHLREIQAAYPRLAPDCVVMIDDCDLPHGGKGKYVIDFLTSQGWKIIAKNYQVILRRNPAETDNRLH